MDPPGEAAVLAFPTSPLQKLPPAPDYLGVYLGVALFIVTACILGWQRADRQRFFTVGYPRFASWIGQFRNPRRSCFRKF